MSDPSECQSAPINTECKKILKTILKEIKKTGKQMTNLQDRFDVRVDYVNSLRDGFMSLEDRLIIMEHSLAALILEKQCSTKSIPPPPTDGSEYEEKKKEVQKE
jgi:hypothetical protein